MTSFINIGPGVSVKILCSPKIVATPPKGFITLSCNLSHNFVAATSVTESRP